EIFLHTVQPSDTTGVILPAQKIIDELLHLRVRDDQTAEPIVAQVETPFLKLMVEESEKFGTTVAPFTTTELTLPIEPSASAPAGSALPRVPASSGPPVPPAAPPAAAPTRIPFQMPPQAAPPKIAEQTPAPPPPVREGPTVAPIAAGPLEPTQEPMVTLSLHPILASLPPMQVAGDVASIPADSKISFRMTLITPQLASGKVVISPKDF